MNSPQFNDKPLITVQNRRPVYGSFIRLTHVWADDTYRDLSYLNNSTTGLIEAMEAGLVYMKDATIYRVPLRSTKPTVHSSWQDGGVYFSILANYP